MKILTYPNPILRNKSVDVEPHSMATRSLVNHLVLTLKQSGGIGLSAPQIGFNKNVFITNLNKEKGQDRVYINPKITKMSEEMQSYTEGCLSFPELFLTVDSPKSITVKYFNRDLKLKEETLHGLEAICAHHEIMHLEGNLIIDRYKEDLEKKIQEIRLELKEKGTITLERDEYLKSLEKIVKS